MRSRAISRPSNTLTRSWLNASDAEKETRPAFSLKLRYVGEKLVEKVLDGKAL